MMPDNYGGGGGSLANRYFMNIYPMFLFLPAIADAQARDRLALGHGRLLHRAHPPLAHSTTSAPSDPRQAIPLSPCSRSRYTLINDLPTNTDAVRLPPAMGHALLRADRFLYFLNDNYNPKHREENGWWTYGDKTADMVLRTLLPGQGSRRPSPEQSAPGQRDHRQAGRPDADGSSCSPCRRATCASRSATASGSPQSHQYRFKVRAAKGSIPYLENRTSDEKRHLGVFFELELIPQDALTCAASADWPGRRRARARRPRTSSSGCAGRSSTAARTTRASTSTSGSGWATAA